jgi:hypothetical protein
MRLDFNILWFENQPNDVKTQVEEIEEHLQAVGFIPHIKMVPDGSNIEELGEEQSRYDEFDLVVVDYDLGHPGRNGDWVAQQIRRHFGFTDIIFYSGKRPGELRKMVYEGGIDGVYCFNRPDLAEKLATHIDQVMRRLSRLEAMRGLAMGVVGRCDDEFRSLLLGTFNNADQEERSNLEAQLEKLVASARDVGTENFVRCTTFEEKLFNRSVTSFTLFKLVMFLLKGDARCTAQRKLLSEYDPKVLEPRNRLAHACESRTDSGWTVESQTKPAITLDDFPQLRKDMASHLANIRAIAPLLGLLVSNEPEK